MIHFVVQARSGSTRMPNKILLPFFEGKSILDLLINKLKQVQGTKVVIATSVNSNCDVIEEVAGNHNVACFRGSENDVLQRFIDAAEANNAERIIRICSDNPFLDLESINKLVSFVNSQSGCIDYASFMINGTPSIKTHYGFWTEYVTLDALKRVKSLTDESLYHEHVTNFIYANPDKFNIQWIDGPDIIKSHKDIRLTIDTQEDFNNAQRIYSDLCATNLYPSIDQVVSYLDSHNNYYLSMKKQIEKNSK
jgi:Spore coat polysaccharide biosynthesis protein F, CMP-KDO synthetase homolog